jgi:hypothetical protein
MYSVFHRFRQVKFANGGSILSSRLFLLLPQPPLKMMLVIKVAKIGSKMIENNQGAAVYISGRGASQY